MPMATMALIAPGPKTAVMHDGDEQRREGEDEVVEPHDRLVDATPPLRRGQQAERHADAQRRSPTATSATAIELRAPTMIIESDVAAEMVGAEPVRAPRAAAA